VYLAFYLENELFQNATESTVAFIGGLTIGQILLVAPLVSLFSVKLGIRGTLAIGTILETAALTQ
jgi:hypothetical protein